MKMRSLDLRVALLLFLTTYCLLVYRIDALYFPYFDENFYISAARQFIQHSPQGYPTNENWSHPPLGKILMGMGMNLMGDVALGWRFISLISGCVIVTGMYFIGLILFKSRKHAGITALLCLASQSLFVLSRTATLDAPMMALITFGILFFIQYQMNQSSNRYLYASSLFFGLATAVKWFGVVPGLLCLGGLGFGGFGIPTVEKVPRRIRTILTCSAFFVGSYFVSFLPFLQMSHPPYAPPLHSASSSSTPSENSRYQLRDLIYLQGPMLTTHLKHSSQIILEESPWYSWAISPKIFWVSPAFVSHLQPRTMQGTGLVGNPLIQWGGFLCMMVCLGHFFRSRSKAALWISLFYFGMYLFWALIEFTTQANTFATYYFPAYLMLPLAIVYVSQTFKVPSLLVGGFVAAALLVFAVSYPLLSDLPLSEEDFLRRVHWLYGDYGHFTMSPEPNSLAR